MVWTDVTMTVSVVAEKRIAVEDEGIDGSGFLYSYLCKAPVFDFERCGEVTDCNQREGLGKIS